MAFFHYQGNTCSLFSNSNNREIYNTERGRKNLSSYLPLPEVTVGNSVTEISLTFPGVCKYRRLHLLKDGIRLFCDLLPSLATQSRTAFDVCPIHVSTGYPTGYLGNQALQSMLPGPLIAGVSNSITQDHTCPHTSAHALPVAFSLPSAFKGWISVSFVIHQGNPSMSDQQSLSAVFPVS